MTHKFNSAPEPYDEYFNHFALGLFSDDELYEGFREVDWAHKPLVDAYLLPGVVKVGQANKSVGEGQVTIYRGTHFIVGDENYLVMSDIDDGSEGQFTTYDNQIIASPQAWCLLPTHMVQELGKGSAEAGVDQILEDISCLAVTADHDAGMRAKVSQYFTDSFNAFRKAEAAEYNWPLDSND